MFAAGRAPKLLFLFAPSPPSRAPPKENHKTKQAQAYATVSGVTENCKVRNFRATLCKTRGSLKKGPPPHADRCERLREPKHMQPFPKPEKPGK